MNPTQPVQKPKIDNNALFAQRLIDNPPEYNIGELVKYTSKKATSGGIGYVTGRVFNEGDKIWKYTIKPYSLNINMDDVVIISKHAV